MIEIVMEPKDKWPIGVTLVPVFFTRNIQGTERVKKAIISMDEKSRWPADERSRTQIADQVRLWYTHNGNMPSLNMHKVACPYTTLWLPATTQPYVPSTWL